MHNPTPPSFLRSKTTQLRSSSSLSKVLSSLSRLDANSLLGQDVYEKRAGAVVLADGVHGLVLLVALHVLDVHVEEV
jgi:hypothetical protein